MCLCLVVAHSHRFWTTRFFTPPHIRSLLASFWSTHPLFLILFLLHSIHFCFSLSHSACLSGLLCTGNNSFFLQCNTIEKQIATRPLSITKTGSSSNSCSTSNSYSSNNISNSDVHTPLVAHTHARTHAYAQHVVCVVNFQNNNRESDVQCHAFTRCNNFGTILSTK